MKKILFLLLLSLQLAGCARVRSKVHEEKGEAKLEANDPEGAMAQFDRAIKLKRDDGDLYRKRGMLKFELNDLAGALSDLNSAEM